MKSQKYNDLYCGNRYVGSHFSLTYYLLVAVIEYLIKQLQAGGFVLVHSSRVQSIVAGTGVAGAGDRWSQCTQKQRMLIVASLSAFCSVQGTSPWNGTAHCSGELFHFS